MGRSVDDPGSPPRSSTSARSRAAAMRLVSRSAAALPTVPRPEVEVLRGLPRGRRRSHPPLPSRERVFLRFGGTTHEEGCAVGLARGGLGRRGGRSPTAGSPEWGRSDGQPRSFRQARAVPACSRDLGLQPLTALQRPVEVGDQLGDRAPRHGVGRRNPFTSSRGRTGDQAAGEPSV